LESTLDARICPPRRRTAPAPGSRLRDVVQIRGPARENLDVIGDDVVLRRAVVADAAAVTELVAAAYAKYLARMPFRPRPMDADYAAVLAATDSWVAELDGRIRAVLVCALEPDHLLIENVAVHPDAQGRGLGGRLLELAEEHARANGRPEVRLYTNEVMVENLRLYAGRGYRETGRESAGGFGRVFLAKRLVSRPSPG